MLKIYIVLLTLTFAISSEKCFIGVNYGNSFIPEDFFANQDFYEKNSIPKVASQYSLCDLKGDSSKNAMTSWFDGLIIQHQFSQMRDFGINVVRLPLGYWNVVKLPQNPKASDPQSQQRMGNLNNIMSLAQHQVYINELFQYAQKYDFRILLDLHGAPGSQSGQSNTGCSFKSDDGSSQQYWSKYPFNREWTINALKELAQICHSKGNLCYGVELLNEPAWEIDRSYLKSFYKDAIKEMRKILPLQVPVVIMEWGPLWYFWDSKEQEYFPYNEYGKILWDTHIYEFQNTVEQEEVSWNLTQFPMVKWMSDSVNVFIGEFTLSLNQDIPTDQLNPWAKWIQQKVIENGAFGAMMWNWKSKAHKFWGMLNTSTIDTPGGVDWKGLFSQYPQCQWDSKMQKEI